MDTVKILDHLVIQVCGASNVDPSEFDKKTIHYDPIVQLYCGWKKSCTSCYETLQIMGL
jgi:hypothetical protein